jgi:hypothetical protein
MKKVNNMVSLVLSLATIVTMGDALWYVSHGARPFVVLVHCFTCLVLATTLGSTVDW